MTLKPPNIGAIIAIGIGFILFMKLVDLVIPTR